MLPRTPRLFETYVKASANKSNDGFTTENTTFWESKNLNLRYKQPRLASVFPILVL